MVDGSLMETRAGSEAQWEKLTLDALGELGWLPLDGIAIAPGSGERDTWDDLLTRPRRLAAMRQLVYDSTVSEGVVDIYDAAGIPKPDLGALTPQFVKGAQNAHNPQLAIEALRALAFYDAVAARSCAHRSSDYSSCTGTRPTSSPRQSNR